MRMPTPPRARSNSSRTAEDRSPLSFLGRLHHLLDHGAGQALARQRRHVPAVGADVQGHDVGVELARDEQGGRDRGFAG